MPAFVLRVLIVRDEATAEVRSPSLAPRLYRVSRTYELAFAVGSELIIGGGLSLLGINPASSR